MQLRVLRIWRDRSIDLPEERFGCETNEMERDVFKYASALKRNQKSSADWSALMSLGFLPLLF